jgi:hypothetical protein
VLSPDAPAARQVPTPLSVGGAALVLASTAFLGVFVRRQQVADQSPAAGAGAYSALPADAARPARV